jgi:hypothetical protein
MTVAGTQLIESAGHRFLRRDYYDKRARDYWRVVFAGAAFEAVVLRAK